MIKNTPLVDIAKKFSQLKIDMKYATDDNLTGKKIYGVTLCLLHEDAAHALGKSIAIAAAAGLTLLVLDAYRPQKAQELLWRACPNKDYVIPVSQGSNHSRGTAVDVTLIDRDGQILDMGTGFDEMNERSHVYHPDIPIVAQRNRLLLNAIMFGGGFTGIVSEWWHFELPCSSKYPVLEDAFTCMEAQE